MNLGPANAYLDGEKIIGIAKGLDCDAVHPGYGFVGLFSRAMPATLPNTGPSSAKTRNLHSGVQTRE